MRKMQMENVGDSWKFKWPKEIYEANEFFYEGLDYLDNGELKKAEKCFKKAIDIFPEHIDARCVLYDFAKTEEEASRWINGAIGIGLDSFPKSFKENDKLEWGWLENRAFLRAYHIKALIELEEGNKNKAIEMFNKIIGWNPNDNQGIREILANIYTKDQSWDDLILLGKKYPKDVMPSVAFGAALALYKKGDQEKADKQLKKAIEDMPKCGQILLEDKPKKPKETMPGYITIGGDDQAYEFWKEQGEAWRNKDVQEWLIKTIEETKNQNVK